MVFDADQEISLEGKQIMPETRFTEFPALSVDPRVGNFWSALETDDWLLFLPIIIKMEIVKKEYLQLCGMTANS